MATQRLKLIVSIAQVLPFFGILGFSPAIAGVTGSGEDGRRFAHDPTVQIYCYTSLRFATYHSRSLVRCTPRLLGFVNLIGRVARMHTRRLLKP
jgi:hypothetical protein